MPFWSRSTDVGNDRSIEKDLSSKPEIIEDISSSSLSRQRHAATTDTDTATQQVVSQSSLESSNELAAVVSSEPWTSIFPEALGIRQSVEDSPFRWCVRESGLWSIATGTLMGLHRLRMQSRPFFAGKVAFATVCLVYFPSYYFCAKRREQQERVIEMMMAVNDFRPGEEMPEAVPLNEYHPFLNTNEGNGEDDVTGLQKEFVARLKERKDWQEPHQTQDAGDVFKEVKRAPRPTSDVHE